MFLQKIQQFLYGRYGGDRLNTVLLVFGVVLSIVGALWWPLMILSYAVILYVLFRTFSKNIPARQRELEGFMRLWRPIQGWSSLQKRKFMDRKYYKYFRCPACKQNLRAPRGRGKITVTCQKCRNQFFTKA